MAVVNDLRTECILIGDRLRPLNPTAVADLTESVRRLGQIQPITVHHRNGLPYLVTGHHRLMAARALEMEMIACVVLPPDTTVDDCLQIEIAENLHRSDLTKAERDRHIQLLAEIIERTTDLQSGQSVPIESRREDGRGHRPKGTVAKVAEQVGLSQKTVRRALNPEAEKEKRKAVSEAADRAEAKAEERREREAKQAEADRQRNEHVSALPEHIQRAEAAKADRAKAVEPDQADRIAELEESVRILEAENARLTEDAALYEPMRVQWEQGGFAKVVAGKDETIRVLEAQVETESADKASWARSAKWLAKTLKETGYSRDIVIDMKTGAIRNG